MAEISGVVVGRSLKIYYGVFGGICGRVFGGAYLGMYDFNQKFSFLDKLEWGV